MKLPVSQAAVAKRLGFSYDELSALTLKTKDVHFVNVPSASGKPLSWPSCFERCV